LACPLYAEVKASAPVQALAEPMDLVNSFLLSPRLGIACREHCAGNSPATPQVSNAILSAAVLTCKEKFKADGCESASVASDVRVRFKTCSENEICMVGQNAKDLQGCLDGLAEVGKDSVNLVKSMLGKFKSFAKSPTEQEAEPDCSDDFVRKVEILFGGDYAVPTAITPEIVDEMSCSQVKDKRLQLMAQNDRLEYDRNLNERMQQISRGEFEYAGAKIKPVLSEENINALFFAVSKFASELKIKNQCYRQEELLALYCYTATSVLAPNAALKVASVAKVGLITGFKLVTGGEIAATSYAGGRFLSQAIDARYAAVGKLQNELKTRSLKKMDKATREAKNAELTKLRNEVEALNKAKYQQIMAIRIPDNSAQVQKLRNIEGRMRPVKNRLAADTEQLEHYDAMLPHLRGKDVEIAKLEIQAIRESVRKDRVALTTLTEEYEDVRKTAVPEMRMKQITGRDVERGKPPENMETPDPTIYVGKDGKLKLMGSGQRYFEYDNMDQFLRGEKGTAKAFDLRYPDGTKIQGPYHTGELPWDLSIVRWENGEEVMYGGALSPKRFRKGGKPSSPGNTTVVKENWTRSSHAFRRKLSFTDPKTGKEVIYDSFDDFAAKNAGKGLDYLKKAELKEVWVRTDKDLFGKVAGNKETWDGHNYGRRILTNPDGSVFRDESGDAWVMYEAIVSRKGKAPGGHLGDTKMFAQRMKDPYSTKGKRIEILSAEVDGEVLPLAVRSLYPQTKLTLVEGPNPAQGLVSAHDLKLTKSDALAVRERLKGTPFEKMDPNEIEWQIVGGATGDYPTDKYAMIFGVRPYHKSLPKSDQLGPLIPLTKVNAKGQRDLIDFGSGIRKQYGISWGPSRPDLFKDERGQWWVIFHGVDETVLAKNLNPREWPSNRVIENFHRNIYIAPVRWTVKDGLPHPELISGLRPAAAGMKIRGPAIINGDDKDPNERKQEQLDEMMDYYEGQ
jgi:hypothetical protein